MNRTNKIKFIGDELTRFIETNAELDPEIIADKVKEIADQLKVKYQSIINTGDPNAPITNQIFIIGDLALFEVMYDIIDDEGNAEIHSQVYGIEDKEQFLKTIDTDTRTGRVIYNFIAGKDIADRFS